MELIRAAGGSVGTTELHWSDETERARASAAPLEGGVKATGADEAAGFDMILGSDLL